MRHLVAPQNALRGWKPHLPKKIPILLALASLALLPAFAADPDPWRPSPEMTGTFRSLVRHDLLVVSPDAHLKLVSENGRGVHVGTFRPDPSGIANRCIAKLFLATENAPEFSKQEPLFLILAYEPDNAVWQILAWGNTPDGMEWLKDRRDCVETDDGLVRYLNGWFRDRFISDQPLAANAPEITPEAARQRLLGIWENFGEGFRGVSLCLASNGYGIFGASVAAVPCAWRIRKTNDGWRLLCKAYAGGTTPDKISYLLIKADPHLQYLQLLALESTVEAATAAAEALDANETPAYLYHSCSSIPQESAEYLSSLIPLLPPNPPEPDK